MKKMNTPKKFDIVMSAGMQPRSVKTAKMVNHLLQNHDSAVIFEPATGLSCLYQKIGRSLAF